MKTNPYRERIRNIELAKDSFLKAAASLTDPFEDNLTFALLEGAMGLLFISKADTDYKSRDKVCEFLKRKQRSRRREGNHERERHP